MEDKLLRYTLRLDRHLFAKFRYIAEYEGRSANREIEQMIKKSALRTLRKRTEKSSSATANNEISERLSSANILTKPAIYAKI